MIASSHTRISEVFRSTGQPTITYVHRKQEQFEETLKSAILHSGQLCLITGPSKTGKTTLYKKVLEELGRQPLVVRCDKSLTPNEFWAKALEAINFTRLREVEEGSKLTSEAAAKIGGNIGWGWLASLIGEATLGISSEASEGEIRERILSRPSPLHLIPLLKKMPVCLVVEDYHYLADETKEVIFQQWKSFIDEEVSVIVLGTAHHAIDIISANKDLLARVSHIEVSRWSTLDLEEIVQKGFEYLKIPISAEVKGLIANESVGLPILTQQCCEQLFIDKGVREYAGTQQVGFTPQEAQQALLNLARTKYRQLESYYNRLITGPRKRARRYDTYELILSCFAQEPVKFSLRRHEIDERIENIRALPKNKKPPAASISSTLRALDGFQSRAGIELLEWKTEENVLYILEPSFLFYLRWRGIRELGERSRKSIGGVWIRGILDSWIKSNTLLNVKFSDSVQLALNVRALKISDEALKTMKELTEKSDAPTSLAKPDQPSPTEKSDEE